jgi:3',5'-cyclic AMP phosphodiesterase CpdA
MKRFIRTILLVVVFASVLSLIPVLDLYIKKAPVTYTNDEAVKKLEGNKGDYFGFIVFGDNHAGLILNDSAALRLVNSMNRETRFKKLPIDFVMSSGDVTFRGSAWDYSIYNKIRSAIKYPVISGIGNHDDDNVGYGRFKKYIEKDEFSFADRNSYFIVLNDIVGEVSDEQFSWLESELVKAQGYKHRFIVMHKPPFSPYQQAWYRPELGAWSHRFMKLCEKYKVDMVFSGHEHMSRERTFGGVRYITGGGGGMISNIPTWDGGFLHYAVVRVNGDYIDYEIRKIFPPVWEFFTYYMWKDIFYFLKEAL